MSSTSKNSWYLILIKKTLKMIAMIASNIIEIFKLYYSSSLISAKLNTVLNDMRHVLDK